MASTAFELNIKKFVRTPQFKAEPVVRSSRVNSTDSQTTKTQARTLDQRTKFDGSHLHNFSERGMPPKVKNKPQDLNLSTHSEMSAIRGRTFYKPRTEKKQVLSHQLNSKFKKKSPKNRMTPNPSYRELKQKRPSVPLDLSASGKSGTVWQQLLSKYLER